MKTINNLILRNKIVLKNFIKLKTFEFDPVEYIILPDQNLVYLVVSKAACTSIKVTIGKSYGIISKQEYSEDIHANEAWVRIFGKLPDAFSGHSSFAVVRNPFERIVSCYLDKVVGAEGSDRSFHYANYPFSIDPKMSFSTFVDRVSRISDIYADRHFKSQYHIIKKYGKRPDHVLKVESLIEDWKQLATNFNLEKTLENKNRSILEKQDSYFSYYDRDIYDKVSWRYRKDIEAFGYLQAQSALKNYLNQKEEN